VTTRHWKLVVTEIGSTGALAEAIVEAPNWMAGIKLARGRIGEPEAIPQGASCTVAPDGRVTVFDSARRRSYVLSPLSDSGDIAGQVSYPPGVFTASSVPAAPPPVAPAPVALPTPPSSAQRQRPKTMAYILDGPLPAPQPTASSPTATSPSLPVVPRPTMPEPAPPPAAPPSASSSRAAMRRTMAFVPGQFDLPPLPTREVVVGAQPQAAPAPVPAPAVPAAPSVPDAPSAPRVVFSSSVEPNDESPLHYHMVGLHMGGQRSTVEIERAMFAELGRVKATIGEASEGHLVQIHVYAEPVDGPREGAEIAQLTWRGWRRETNVRFPKLEEEVSNQTIPGAERYPTAGGDPRLADVLDAFEDVWFLATPNAGLDFVARIAEDLFEGAHVLCAGLSPDSADFVPVTARGSLAGFAMPKKLEANGLLKAALAGAGRPVAVADGSADPRVVAAVDGANLGPVLVAVAPHGGEALGYLRLARPKGAATFGVVDAEILRAIVERLGLFLRLRGACIAKG